MTIPLEKSGLCMCQNQKNTTECLRKDGQLDCRVSRFVSEPLIIQEIRHGWDIDFCKGNLHLPRSQLMTSRPVFFQQA